MAERDGGTADLAAKVAIMTTTHFTLATRLAAIRGGHGQLFVQQFAGGSLEPVAAVQSLVPEEAARRITAPRVIGSGAAELVEARGSGEDRALLCR